MTMRQLRDLVAGVLLTALCTATPAQAEPTLLNGEQIRALFDGDTSYEMWGKRAKLRFDFQAGGSWSVETEGGHEASGNWNISGNRVCREQTAYSGNWRGLSKEALCFTISREDDKFFLGSRKFEIWFTDPQIAERLNNFDTTPAPGAGSAQLAAEKQELEAQRLALKREKLAFERQKLEAEKRRLAAQQSEATQAIARIPDIDFGRYHAIVIGIDDYTALPKLKTAVTDARAVARTLESSYGYKVHLLENPTRADIIDKFDELRETLVESDNLLIYYAGHGWLDQQSGRGYWLPVNARSDRRSRWLSNSDLTDALQALFAKHVMIVADSCYSGTLTRSIKPTERTPDYVERVAKKRTRVVLTSGGLEPVADSGGGEHSVFAAQFLKALRTNRDVLDGAQLFEQIRRNVTLNADQTPQYSYIRRAGHEGGDFLFVRRGNE